MLALFFLLRSALDPVNNYYYPLPFVAALAFWELVERRSMPVFALIAVVWLSAVQYLFVRIDPPGHAAESASFLLGAGIAGALMSLRLFAPGFWVRLGSVLSRVDLHPEWAARK